MFICRVSLKLKYLTLKAEKILLTTSLQFSSGSTTLVALATMHDECQTSWNLHDTALQISVFCSNCLFNQIIIEDSRPCKTLVMDFSPLGNMAAASFG